MRDRIERKGGSISKNVFFLNLSLCFTRYLFQNYCNIVRLNLRVYSVLTVRKRVRYFRLYSPVSMCVGFNLEIINGTSGELSLTIAKQNYSRAKRTRCKAFRFINRDSDWLSRHPISIFIQHGECPRPIKTCLYGQRFAPPTEVHA